MIVYIVVEATTVITFALDVTAILQTPMFWTVFDDENNYVLSCYLKKKC